MPLKSNKKDGGCSRVIDNASNMEYNLIKKFKEIFYANPQVTITMQDGKRITVELYPDVAPNTVNNFISLVSKDFYNGLIFHRVIKGFMIQGGCPNGTGTGGPGYAIKGEFAQNGCANGLKHERGVISMARAMSPNSAGSQFLLCTRTLPISTEHTPHSGALSAEWK